MKRRFLLTTALILAFCIGWASAQSNFTTSLHFTREGKRTAYKAENGGFEGITGVPVEVLGCMKCHSSTGMNAAGQIIDPATYVPNCQDCHDAQNNVEEATCLNCHTRQKLERAKFPDLDVHRAAGLTCISCHSKEELHGDDGVAYTSLKEPGAIKTECADCHDSVSQTPGHVIHSDTVDCPACHSVTVVNCVSCHFESLTEGRVSRPNAQIQNYRLLLKKEGKADVGSLTTHTYAGKTNVILSSFHSHVITRNASDCSDCHFNFGGSNPAIHEYNETGTITLNKWNEDTKKIDGPLGVVPIPIDWRTALLFDYAVYTGDPASATTDPEAWEFLKTGFDNGHLYFAEPLDTDAMRKLGMVVREPVLYFPLFADGASGSIEFKTGLVLTNVGEDATLALEFYDRTGAPLVVTLDSQGPDSKFEVPVWKGRTFSVETSGAGDPGAGGIQLGYVVVKVQTPPGSQILRVSADPTQLGGTAIFSRSDNGVLVTEAGVPGALPMPDFTLFLDSQGERDTGLAVVNPPSGSGLAGSAAAMTVTVWDPDFTEKIAEIGVALQAGEAFGKFIWEVFRDEGADASVYEPMQEMTANVTVSSNVPVAALVIRQNDDPALSFPEEVPTLTVFPVVPGRADVIAAGTLK